MTDEQIVKALRCWTGKTVKDEECAECSFGEDCFLGEIVDAAEKRLNELKAENAALRERLKKAATFALDMCSEDDCAGDGSVGLPPCDMWHAWDTDGNGVNIESGCYLKEYLTELKGE